MNKYNNFFIAGREIGINSTPFIIAEMSGNHNNSLSRALEIVDSIARSGAHAIKLQTYTADMFTYCMLDKINITSSSALASY